MGARGLHGCICAAIALCMTACALISGLDEFELVNEPPPDGNGGDGGSGGGTPAGCVPSDNLAGVPSDCGVWVSSSLGNDGNAGVKEASR